MNETFSVCQFFEDGSYEYVRRNVDAEDAAKAFHFYTHNVSARIGLTARVIVTDSGDYIAAEWHYRQGVTFPPKES